MTILKEMEATFALEFDEMVTEAGLASMWDSLHEYEAYSRVTQITDRLNRLHGQPHADLLLHTMPLDRKALIVTQEFTSLLAVSVNGYSGTRFGQMVDQALQSTLRVMVQKEIERHVRQWAAETDRSGVVVG